MFDKRAINLTKERFENKQGSLNCLSAAIVLITDINAMNGDGHENDAFCPKCFINLFTKKRTREKKSVNFWLVK